MLKAIAFDVIGDQQLHCHSCEQRVERLLKSLPGVEQVRVQAGNQRIKVLFNSAVLEPSAIVEQLGTAGYKTKIGGSTSDLGI
jgi:copper chaperone CopZ